jgi:predicted RNA-binding Zn ribbon-like protein
MTEESYRFPARLGGNLSLDFTNTIEFRGTERETEFLHAYDHLAAWCSFVSRAEGSASPETALAGAGENTDAEFRRALGLRDALYRLFTAVIAGEPPAPDDLNTLNRALQAGGRHVEPDGSGFAWGWSQPDLLAPIAQAAAELLTSPDLARVRQCPNCGWLFVDTSRNHSRRWCSMEFCGSQMKSRRQYERRKSGKA